MSRERRLLCWTLLTLLGLTVLRWLLAAVVAMMLPDVTEAPAANYIALMLQSVLLFALPGWLLVPCWKRPQLRGRLGVCWAGALATLLLRATVTPLHSWMSTLRGAEATPIFLPADGWTRVLAILALAIVPAVCEELFFRGALLSRLLQCASCWQAALITVLIFALMHGTPLGLPGHLLSGLLFTLLMLHTGRLLVPMAAHALYNLSALCWPETPAFVPWVCGGALAVVLVWFAIRTPRGRRRQLGKRELLLAAALLLVMAAQYSIWM